MDKNIGIHFYINIKNLIDIIKEEEKIDDDLKRTLHRLNTYFVGFSKLIKQYGGFVEKYTSGRAHVIFKQKNEEDEIDENVLEALVACYIYTNNIFNSLGKYSKYTKFKIHGGIDFGSYYDYNIVDAVNGDEYTSIGSVANNSAKVQSFAPKDYVYAMGKFVDKLPTSLKSKFIRLSDEEVDELYGKIKSKVIYKAKYNDIFDESRLSEIEANLDDVKKRVEDESKSINLKDISFEGVNKQLSFDRLSLKGTNKKIEDGYVLCADIRGFTKLFNNNDNNLDNLKDVMEDMYIIMGDVTNDSKGTKVQYQGDRIVIVYNDYSDEEDAIVRMLKAAFTLNSKIQNLNNDEDIKEKLGSNKIYIGIGCGSGKLIATRLGLNGNNDNIVLSDAYKIADKAEDEYAEKSQVVIRKELKEKIEEKDESSNELTYSTLIQLFESIGKSGFYKSSATIEEFNEKLSENEQTQNSINKYAINNSQIRNNQGNEGPKRPMPWGSIW